MQFLDTQPMDFAARGGDPALEEFRVRAPAEVRALLKSLQDGNVRVNLNGSDGTAYTTTIWTLDSARNMMSLSADASDPRLQRLVDADDIVVVGYLQSIKVQFELDSLLLVHAGNSSALQAPWPRIIYRFQRRGSFRVRPAGRVAPVARLQHPQHKELALALRVIDVSLDGCALALPASAPPLRPGDDIAGVTIELDAETTFTTRLRLHHITAMNPEADSVRLGCSMLDLAPEAARMLQRYIDQTQKRRRLLTLG